MQLLTFILLSLSTILVNSAPTPDALAKPPARYERSEILDFQARNRTYLEEASRRRELPINIGGKAHPLLENLPQVPLPDPEAEAEAAFHREAETFHLHTVRQPDAEANPAKILWGNRREAEADPARILWGNRREAEADANLDSLERRIKGKFEREVRDRNLWRITRSKRVPEPEARRVPLYPSTHKREAEADAARRVPIY